MATSRHATFELTAADGGPLRGDVRSAAGGAARPAVVICHGFKGFKDWGFFPQVAQRLARGGVTAVSFNFGGSGVGPDGERFTEPERFAHATFGKDLRDLEIVLDALGAGMLLPDLAPPTAVGLFGHSRGGGVAILAAAARTDIRALVTWSAISSPLRWGPETVAQWRRRGRLEVTNQRTGDVLPVYLDVLDEIEGDRDGRLDMRTAARRIRVPWLIAHGEVDETVSVAEARALHEAGENRSELLVIRHGSHTFGAKHPWAGSTSELDQAMEATVTLFLRELF